MLAREAEDAEVFRARDDEPVRGLLLDEPERDRLLDPDRVDRERLDARVERRLFTSFRAAIYIYLPCLSVGLPFPSRRLSCLLAVATSHGAGWLG